MLRFLRRLVVLAVVTAAVLAWRERKILENQERYGLP